MIKTTTLKLPSETLIELKALAIRKGKSQNDIINEFIIKGLKATGKPKRKQKLKVLVEDNPNANIDDMIGSIKTDKPVNAVELVNEVRRGE